MATQKFRWCLFDSFFKKNQFRILHPVLNFLQASVLFLLVCSVLRKEYNMLNRYLLGPHCTASVCFMKRYSRLMQSTERMKIQLFFKATNFKYLMTLLSLPRTFYDVNQLKHWIFLQQITQILRPYKQVVSIFHLRRKDIASFHRYKRIIFQKTTSTCYRFWRSLPLEMVIQKKRNQIINFKDVLNCA